MRVGGPHVDCGCVMMMMMMIFAVLRCLRHAGCLPAWLPAAAWPGVRHLAHSGPEVSCGPVACLPACCQGWQGGLM